ncbi:DUF294 nucleotidyltransferase-like domain-containing protein [Marinobacterium weihaiense]|uniref:Signal transduction protein n=1 Tax=Marinobacterium weihaiense TaxID=2851016 RepID=A0ABS6MBL3_9GAMM|nr:DUF294 nucleotidyltransferase-like domain-containing protein [Marinobacterium weihaiense]MBV0933674.1 signal transduction protein [Marinobacterium weihaiense]
MQTPWRQVFLADDEPPRWQAVLEPLQAALGAPEPKPEQGLAQYRACQPRLARALLSLQLPGWLVSELISDHNDRLYRRAIAEAVDAMQEQGWGEPPIGFCVLVMGSGGRHESLLHPDQDNALILEDYPPERHVEIDGWFTQLAERFTAALDAAGIPFCRGYVMASQPLWRKPVSAWCEQMRLWMATRRVKLVQLCNILFDFNPVYGDEALAHRLRAAIQAQVPDAGLFMHEMAELLDEAPVALDRFDRLRGDGVEAPHPYAINLKRQGLLPLTASLRLLALKRGLSAVGSRQRLSELHAMQALTDDRAWGLQHAFEHLMQLLLDAQLHTHEAGGQPDNWLDTTRLCDGERRQLQWNLQQIQAFQRHVKQVRAG